MSEIFEEKIEAHNNIYLEHLGRKDLQRVLFLRYGIPSLGINEETGILNLIPGYSANINSKVYRKMISTFPDKYNLVVIQCDYFGNKYMGSDLSKFSDFLIHSRDIEKIDIRFRRFKEENQESVTEFNDCGIMQALDVLYSTLHVVYSLVEKGHIFNVGKIILYGSSHGGYVSHLANIICPQLFSYMFDISGYIFPCYMKEERTMYYDASNKRICEFFDIFIKEHPELQYVEELYSLKWLYNNVENKCKILSFNGIKDRMVPIDEKQELIDNIDNAVIMAISEADVDNDIFSTATHGLGLNFIRFFDVVMPELNNIECNLSINLDERINIGDDLVINYESGFPIVEYIKWRENV